MHSSVLSTHELGPSLSSTGVRHIESIYFRRRTEKNEIFILNIGRQCALGGIDEEVLQHKRIERYNLLQLQPNY